MQEKPSACHQDLTYLLSRKIKAFEDYYMATVLLSQTIKEKDIMKIKSIINSRESQIECITMIDREIQKLSSDKLISANKNVNGLLAELEEIIRKTRNNDNHCLDSASALLQETSDDLRLTDRGLNGFQGYDKQNSRFLDIKS